MKIIKISLLIITIVLIGCKEEKPKEEIKNTATTKTVQHYYCTNKCENSGGEAAGNCPVCETPYTHNQAFHNQDFLKNGPIKVQSNTPLPNSSTPASPSAPSPAQNSQGAFHYTCGNGCNGGSGTASNCSSCGEPLVHNTIYHN